MTARQAAAAARRNARQTSASQRNGPGSAAAPNGGAVDEESSSEEGEETQDTQNISVASSQPASQLLGSQSQSQSQSQEPSTERLGLFRRALGQLLNVEEVFDEDEGSAEVDELVGFINHWVARNAPREEEFSTGEAVGALKVMDARNQIM
jgi:DNA replication licensing factor MCM3